MYNSKKYINRCIDSIIKQTFQEFELLLIDDGSTDGSLNLCDGYAKQDSRIRVIHKENGGLSSARNAGLAVATGKYIGFIDSDDSVKKNMYSRMIGIIEKYDTDFVALQRANPIALLIYIMLFFVQKESRLIFLKLLLPLS